MKITIYCKIDSLEHLNYLITHNESPNKIHWSNTQRSYSYVQVTIDYDTYVILNDADND